MTDRPVFAPPLGIKSISQRVSSTTYKYFERTCRFCQHCVRNYWFWVLVALFAFLEPILCSRYPTGRIIRGQIAILTVSTVLYLIQLIGVATREWEKIIIIEAMSRLGTVSIKNPLKDFTPLKLLVFFSAEGEYVLEGAMIILGWVFILWRPGLATLRCFRVFRILWFYEVEVFKETTTKYFSPIVGEVFVSRGFKVLKFAINSLTALGNEMFRLTGETRGALLLMMMFFYSAFVLGATLYVETNSTSEYCTSFGLCTWTLIRLTFFDGDGLDFAFFLTKKHRILFFIIMIYLCITAFGILNGLVGVFGTALARASHLAFEEEDDGGVGGEESVLGGVPDDDESLSDKEDDENPNNIHNNSNNNNGKYAMGGKALEEGDEDDEEGVEVYKDEETASPAPRAGVPLVGFLKAQRSARHIDDHGAQVPRAELKRSLRDLLKGPSSRFLVEHFANPAKTSPRAAEAANSESSPVSAAPSTGVGRRLTIKDVVNNLKRNSNATEVLPSASSPSLAAINSPYASMAKPKPAGGGGFANMFGGVTGLSGGTHTRPLPHKSSRNLMSNSHGTSMYAGRGGDAAGGVSPALLSSLLEMHQTLERQGKMLAALTSQVTTLTQMVANNNNIPYNNNSLDGGGSVMSVTSNDGNTNSNSGVSAAVTALLGSPSSDSAGSAGKGWGRGIFQKGALVAPAPAQTSPENKVGEVLQGFETAPLIRLPGENARPAAGGGGGGGVGVVGGIIFEEDDEEDVGLGGGLEDSVRVQDMS